SKGHPIIARNLESLSTAIQLLHSLSPSIVIGLVGDEIVVDDVPMTKADTLAPLAKRLHQGGVERITIDRGVTLDELKVLVDGVATADRNSPATAIPAQPHVRVGRVNVEQRVDSDLKDMAVIKQLYNDAVSAAGSVFDSTQTEGKPDVNV